MGKGTAKVSKKPVTIHNGPIPKKSSRNYREEYVVHGAKVKCNCGSSPTTLVFPDRGYDVGYGIIGLDIDTAPTNFAGTFGKCSITDEGCAPALVARWVEVAKRQNANEGHPLLMRSMVVCTRGGCISLLENGQTLHTDPFPKKDALADLWALIEAGKAGMKELGAFWTQCLLNPSTAGLPAQRGGALSPPVEQQGQRPSTAEALAANKAAFDSWWDQYMLNPSSTGLPAQRGGTLSPPVEQQGQRPSTAEALAANKVAFDAWWERYLENLAASDLPAQRGGTLSPPVEQQRQRPTVAEVKAAELERYGDGRTGGVAGGVAFPVMGPVGGNAEVSLVTDKDGHSKWMAGGGAAAAVGAAGGLYAKGFVTNAPDTSYLTKSGGNGGFTLGPFAVDTIIVPDTENNINYYGMALTFYLFGGGLDVHGGGGYTVELADYDVSRNTIGSRGVMEPPPPTPQLRQRPTAGEAMEADLEWQRQHWQELMERGALPPQRGGNPAEPTPQINQRGAPVK